MTYRSPFQTVRQRPHECRRDDSGLTTLEWLLIVAAVAGLAALAVVLVTNVVSDTSDQISGQNARLTAAQIAAEEVTLDARKVAMPTGTDANAEAIALNRKYKAECNQVKVIYSDIPNIMFNWVADTAGGTPTAPPSSLVEVTTAAGWDVAKIGCHVHVP